MSNTEKQQHELDAQMQMEFPFAKEVESKPPAPAPVAAAHEPGEESSLPVRSDGPALLAMGGIVGEIGPQDLRFPKLKIVQGSGPLTLAFSVGSLVIEDTVLCEPPTQQQTHTLHFVPIALHKYYRRLDANNQLVFDESSAASVEEARLRGWEKWQANAAVHMLLQEPEILKQRPDYENNPLRGYFTIQPDPGADTRWAVVSFFAAGTAYNAVVNPLMSASLTSLVQLRPDGTKELNLSRYLWTFTWKPVMIKEYRVYVPSIKMTGTETPSDVQQFCQNLRALITARS